jgi:replicative DNA helicase
MVRTPRWVLESGDLEQDANLVLGLYNEAKEKADEAGKAGDGQEVSLEVLILKNRQGLSNVSTWLTFDQPRLEIKDKSSSW